MTPFRHVGAPGLVALLTLFCLSPLRAATLGVPSQYATIQAGIDAAATGDTVLVADGTYTGPGNVDLDFGGKNITVQSVNGPAVTVIDCAGSSTDPHRGFYLHSGETAAVIQGFTVKNGYAHQVVAGNDISRGGGLEAYDTTGTTIKNCVITNNTVLGYYQADGGGIDVGDGANIADCTITGNVITGLPSQAGSAGIEAGDSATITGCTVTGNTVSAQNVTAAGIAISTGTVTGCTISGNSIFSDGCDAVGITLSSGTLADCTISGNRATNNTGFVLSGGNGGVCAGWNAGNSTGTSCTVIDCTITDNVTDSCYGAGGIDAINTAISGCTISGNVISGIFPGLLAANASETCGGMRVENSSVTNCVVSGNVSDLGAGGIGMDTVSAVTNCTITGNVTYEGDGGAVQGSGALVNCICYNDSAGQGGEIADLGYGPPSLSVTYCDVQGGYSGAGNFSAVPLFVNGAAGDFHLQPTSFCRAAGTSAGAPTLDKDGHLRPTPPSMGAFDVLGTAWTAVAVSTGPDGFTRVLWDYANGRAAVWKVDASGNLVSQQQFGPYVGWTAKALATGPDNRTHLLWIRSDGAASYYLLDSDNAFVSQQQYGPYQVQVTPGNFQTWTPAGLAVAPDNTVRALWDKTDGTATVWTLDSTNRLTGQQQYGPYPAGGNSAWSAKSLTVGPDGTERLLWINPSGPVSFWRLDAQSRFLDQQQYGPYPGYTAQAITAAPDGTGRVVWTNTDAHIALWTIDSANNYTGQSQYGPYNLWSFQGISVGADGNARLLWDQFFGQSALWSLTPDGGFASNTQYGPY